MGLIKELSDTLNLEEKEREYLSVVFSIMKDTYWREKGAEIAMWQLRDEYADAGVAYNVQELLCQLYEEFRGMYDNVQLGLQLVSTRGKNIVRFNTIRQGLMSNEKKLRRYSVAIAHEREAFRDATATKKTIDYFVEDDLNDRIVK